MKRAIKKISFILLFLLVCSLNGSGQVDVGGGIGNYSNGTHMTRANNYQFTNLKASLRLTPRLSVSAGFDHYFSTYHATQFYLKTKYPLQLPPGTIITSGGGITITSDGSDPSIGISDYQAVNVEVEQKRDEFPLTMQYIFYRDNWFTLGFICGPSFAKVSKTYRYKLDTSRYYAHEVANGYKQNFNWVHAVVGLETGISLNRRLSLYVQGRILYNGERSWYPDDLPHLIPPSFQGIAGIMYGIGKQRTLFKPRNPDPETPETYNGIKLVMHGTPLKRSKLKNTVPGIELWYFRRSYDFLSIIPAIGITAFQYSDGGGLNKSVFGIESSLAGNMQFNSGFHLRTGLHIGKSFAKVGDKEASNAIAGLIFGTGLTIGRLETSLELGLMDRLNVTYPEIRLGAGYIFNAPVKHIDGKAAKPNTGIKNNFRYHPGIRLNAAVFLEGIGKAGIGMQYYYRSYSTLSVLPAIGFSMIGSQPALEGQLSANLQYFKALHLRLNSHFIMLQGKKYHGFSTGSGITIWRFEANADAGVVARSFMIRLGLGYTFNGQKHLLPRE